MGYMDLRNPNGFQPAGHVGFPVQHHHRYPGAGRPRVPLPLHGPQPTRRSLQLDQPQPTTPHDQPVGDACLRRSQLRAQPASRRHPADEQLLRLPYKWFFSHEYIGYAPPGGGAYRAGQSASSLSAATSQNRVLSARRTYSCGPSQ